MPRRRSSLPDGPRLAEIILMRDRIRTPEDYPFTVPVVRSLDRLAFERRLTFFVGENGSGKSTLLEAIALAAGFGAEGGSRNFTAATTASTGAVHPLADALRLSWTRKLTRGFFLRAESLFNVATRVDELDVSQFYGGSLHERSHGEAFLALIRNRFGPGGLYLLDEPEAALSAQRQLTLLALFHQLLRDDPDTQLVVATHSPILLGYPDAAIVSFDGEQIAPIAWEDTVTRSFLADRQFWLDRLLED
jgi:predicted ATPase